MRTRICIGAALFMLAGFGIAGDGPRLVIAPDTPYPRVACTPKERARLRTAFRQGKGPAYEVVRAEVRRADAHLANPVTFPPRGGQHNQWYQCDACEVPLKTVDATHHQCPKCKKIYSGYPYDDVLYAHTHNRNLRAMVDTAWAYAITGQAKYAEHAASILLGYSERYLKYPLHGSTKYNMVYNAYSGGHLFEQTLNEAVALATTIGPAYDLIHDAPVLKEAEHQAIREKLLLPMLENVGKYRAGKNNWQTWHNAGMLVAGGALGEADWVNRAIQDAKNGFLYQMQASITEDGMWYEGSWGYHFYALKALVLTAEAARRLGVDLWADKRFRKMFTTPAAFSMPGNHLPRFGDDVDSSLHGKEPLLEPAFMATQDPAIRALLSDKVGWHTVLLGREPQAEGSRAAIPSAVFRSSGHVILRAPGPKGLTAALVYGPHGGFHSHYDKLCFVFYAHGQELGVDPGRAASQAYRLPIHKRWYKATVSHNGVMVDGASQQGASGRLVFFAANEARAAAMTASDRIYPGVEHGRLLYLAPDWLLVVDELTGERRHRFDWLYHNRGTAVTCAAATEARDAIQDFVGSEYLKHIHVGRTAEDVQALFTGPKVNTVLRLCGAPGTGITTATGVGRNVGDRVPMVMVTREGRSALFVALLEPCADKAAAVVKDLQAAAKPDGVQITITQTEKREEITLTPAGLTATVNGETVLSARPEAKNAGP